MKAAVRPGRPAARSDRPQFQCPRRVGEAAARLMPRTEIPGPTANAVLFSADRTCCVCRVARKAIHGDAANHDTTNLAVLCLECHDDTMLTGGFGRRLNPDLIRLFGDDWNQRVADRRQAGGGQSRAVERPPAESGPDIAASTDRRTEGESLLRRAAEAGSLDAASNLGAFLDRMGAAEASEKWLTKAAESGHLGAAINLGVKHFEAGDDRVATQWLTMAAGRGADGAAFNLGVVFERMDDLGSARHWYKQAVESGDVRAANNLGAICRAQGSLDEAEMWLRPAAEAERSGNSFA